MRNIALPLAGSAGAIALGLLYIYRAFGPTEAEVVSWGRVSLYAGIALATLSLVAGCKPIRILKLVLGLVCLFLIVLQLPPIILWFAFHGSGISDRPPPSPFVAHWGYAVPHITVATISAFTLYSILANPQKRSR